jgi:NADH-quinone oxidoreductase subunit N
MLYNFTILSPELILIAIALLSQLIAVYCKKTHRVIDSTVILCIALVAFILQMPSFEVSAFHGSFVINGFSRFFKALVLMFTIANIIMYQDFCKISNNEIKYEFVSLALLSTLGIFVSISSRDLLLLFCGLELQALAGYALAAFNTSSYKSSEAALKYFVLGALLSCISLLGMSFIYGFSGSLHYTTVAALLDPAAGSINVGLVIGVILFLSGILFKLSAAPFHMWTPDVYEGAPISAVTYFSTTQKIGVLAILFNVIHFVAWDYTQISVDLIRIAAGLSMIIGALGAIRQESLKRLMGYSTILNVGYVLIGVTLHGPEGDYAAQIYMMIYTVGVIGFFACLIALLGSKAEDATFRDIQGIASNRKTIAAVATIIMFSMIGLPPFAGFFGKYYLFYQAVAAKEFVLVFLGIASSVVASFYYLKIIKTMYFIDSEIEVERIPTNRGLFLVTLISVCFILVFPFFMNNFRI